VPAGINSAIRERRSDARAPEAAPFPAYPNNPLNRMSSTHCCQSVYVTPSPYYSNKSHNCQRNCPHSRRSKQKSQAATFAARHFSFLRTKKQKPPSSPSTRAPTPRFVELPKHTCRSLNPGRLRPCRRRISPSKRRYWLSPCSRTMRRTTITGAHFNVLAATATERLSAFYFIHDIAKAIRKQSPQAIAAGAQVNDSASRVATG